MKKKKNKLINQRITYEKWAPFMSQKTCITDILNAKVTDM